MLGLIFLISAFISYEVSIEGVLGPILPLPPEIMNLPFKIGFWFLGGLILVLPAVIVISLIMRDRKNLD